MPDPEQPLKWLAVGMLYVGAALLAMPFIMAFDALRGTTRNRG